MLPKLNVESSNLFAPRPGIVEERQALLQDLLSAGHEIVFIEPGATRYLMPQFECAAFADIPDIDGRPWRSGDLLCVRKKSDKPLNVDSIAPYDVISYARSPKRFRVFFRTSHDSRGDAPSWIQTVPEFERTVSRRQVNPTRLHWWTSSKQGGRLRDPKSFDLALQAWAEGRTREETIKKLVDGCVRDTDAHALCAELDEKLALWTQHGTGVAKLGRHAKYVPVTKPGVFATTQSSNRPYPKESEDGYRTDPFQRDRDRITWSRGIRQLSGKTQVFSLESDDFLRNRLAHSMEVAQLASTIGSSFGLDPRLIESGSLAHDVGHTPFGHAGEDALNVLFDEISPELGGFNHYEHGVDVIRWLEDAYQSPALGGLPGLNLSSEVAECVFKHTYCQSNGHFSQNEIYQRSKHQKYFSNDLCHVEGQAVRIADKISYLISDIEDGIRVGALDVKHLVSCRLLRRAPLDFVVSSAESLLERFLSQRGLLIGILMEDVIESTDERLSRLGKLDAVRNASRYTVDHSEELQTEVDEVWEKLQVGVLHRDARVRIANLRAAKTVRELAILFAVAPELVDARFSSSHARLSSTDYMSHYHKRVGRKVTLSPAIVRVVAADGGRSLGFRPCDPMQVPVENLVQAKDFVAGLSDARARIVHRTLMSS